MPPLFRILIISLFFVFTSMAYATFGTNPFLESADAIVSCPTDGSRLSTFTLCGIGDIRSVEVSDPLVQSVQWQLLDDNSCAQSVQGCPNLNSSCFWNTISTSSFLNISNSGEYRVILAYANAPVEIFYAKIYQTTYVDAVSVLQGITTHGANDGVIEISVSGNSGPYIYELLDNGFNPLRPYQDSPMFENLGPGEYHIRTLDSSGVCEYLSTQIVLAEPEALFAEMVQTRVTALCVDTGELKINATGGVPPYIYSLNNGIFVTDNTFTDLGVGSYRVQVRDANGVSTYTNGITITGVADISINYTKSDINCFGGQDGFLSVDAFGGSGGYQYELHDRSLNVLLTSQSSNTFTNLSPGIYEIHVRDSEGCKSDGIPIAIQEPAHLDATFDVQSISTYQEQDGIVTVDVSGGAGEYHYAISPDLSTFYTTNTFSNLAAGEYTFLVQDQNGCFIEEVITLAEPSQLLSTLTITEEYTCTSNASLEVSVVGGISPYEYSFDGGSFFFPMDGNSQIISGLSPGTYEITIRDANGIIHTNTTTIEIVDPLNLSLSSVDVTCASNLDGNIASVATGGKGNYRFKLMDIQGNDIRPYQDNGFFDNLGNGKYQVQVIDSGNCTLISSIIEITNAAELVIDNISSQNNTYYGANNGSISFDISGGIPPYSYYINSTSLLPNNAQVLTNLPAGEYSIVVQDAKGCELTIQQTITQPETKSFELLTNAIKGLRQGELTCTDFDADGDLDVLTFGNDTLAKAHSLLYKNDQLAFSETALVGFPTLFEGAMNWSDYNNNGQMDLALTGISSDVSAAITDILEYDGDFSKTNINLSGVSNGAIEWGDFDNDGRKDLLVTGINADSQPTIKLFQNRDSLFVEVNIDNVTGVSLGDAAWADYNSDGLLDFIITGVTGRSPNMGAPITQLYKNTGNGFQLDNTSSFVGVHASSVDWGDADNDGDMDILITGYSSNFEAFTGLYINEGNSFKLLETNLPNVLEGFAKWGDYDNDGDLDVLIAGNRIGIEAHVCMVFSNDGLDFIPVFEGVGLGQASGAWADFNNDGFLDIIVNGQKDDLGLSASIYLNSGIHPNISGKNKMSLFAKNTGPTVPTNLSSEVNGNRAKLIWNASTDDKTAIKSLRYAFRLFKDGEIYISSLRNDSGSLMLVEPGNAGLNNFYITGPLEPGDYEWSVQSIDNSYAYSSFSAPQTFKIDGAMQELEEKREDIDNAIIVYQNPGRTEVVDIVWDVTKVSKTTISMYNTKGNLVSLNEVDAGVSQARLQVISLARGIYFIYIKNAELEEIKKVLIL